MKKISLLLLIALVAMNASAYTYYNNVEIGNFKYSQLGLGSSSSEENYAFLSGLSSAASTSLTTLDIPGYVIYNGNRYRVKQINQNAFHNNTKITNVTFGYGVEYISSYVFDGCTNLKTVNLPSSVKEIGQFVFQNCSSLMIVAFAGEKAPKIYDYTFNLSSSTKRASTATYRGMNALKADAKWVAAFGTSNILRNYGYKVGDFKLYNSTNGCWQYYVIKNGIPYNGNSSNPSLRSSCVLVAATFTDGSNYTISLPQSVGNSDNNAPGAYKFYGVADSAFMNNTSITKIANNNTMAYKIGNYAFYGCSNLTSADVPVDTIGNYAFSRCSKLSSVTITSNLNNTSFIGSLAFGYCALTGEFNIPATIKYIGIVPFYYCSSLEAITVDENNTNYSSHRDALYNKAKSRLIQIPCKWRYGRSRNDLPESLQQVPQYAAAGCSSLKELYLPYGVKQIEKYAFWNCKNLFLVHLPSSAPTINANSFADCDAITRVELNYMTPPSTDFFPAVTNKSDVSLYMPYGTYSAYANSSIWKHYNRKTGPTDHTNCWDIFRNQVYYTVTSTTPHNSKGYDYDGFAKVVKISATEISSPIISTSVNYDMNSFHYEITTIGPYAGDRENVFIVNYGAPNVIDVEVNAFRDSRITELPVFNSLKHIGDSAFYNTKYMSYDDYFHPTKVETIGKYAFYNSGINLYIATTALTSIGEYAFYNCSTLSELFLPHIDGKHPLTCGKYFFGNNAEDFKCWVDYRKLPDYLNLGNVDTSKFYPHIKLDSEWQSFACIKGIDFSGSGLEAFVVSGYNESQKKATLSAANHLKAKNGAVVHGITNTYHRLKYASDGETSSYMVGVTNDSQTVTSGNTISYFKLNATKPVFDKVAPATNFPRGYAYLKLNTSATGGATTIYTNLSGSGAVPGDVNGDGEVTAADVTALYDVLLNNDYSHIVNGDQTGDDDITAADITAVYTILLSN